MRGWLASIIEWFAGGESQGSAQLLVEEVEAIMTVGEWTDRQRAVLNNLIPQGTSPRLQAYLESQLGTATITPWAIFRD
jgi:hypothetical protein